MLLNPKKLTEEYGVDAVRYYLLREIPSLNDGNYSNKRMHEIYVSDLANELGNLVLRITNIAEQDKINIKKRKIKIYIAGKKLSYLKISTLIKF